MRRYKEVERDDLKEYFVKTNIEKAPEGFTSKVMSHIYMQASPVKPEKRSFIPYAYAGITAILVIVSFLAPQTNLKFPEIVLPELLHFTFPQIGESFKLSPTIMYVFGAILLLVIFDSGLKSFFRKEKS